MASKMKAKSEKQKYIDGIPYTEIPKKPTLEEHQKDCDVCQAYLQARDDKMNKPLGKNEKRWKKCPVEDSCWDACIVKGHKCLTWVAYEQGKKESLLLRDAEKMALAKQIQKKWKLAYCGNEMFYDFDEYMRQLVRDLGS